MKNYPSKKNTIAAFILVSLLAHLLVIYALVLSDPLKFSLPVQPHPALFVTFESADARPSIKVGKAVPVTTIPYHQQAPHLSERRIMAENLAQGVGSPKKFSQPEEHALIHKPARVTPLLSGDQNTSVTIGEVLEIAGPEDGNRKYSSDNHISGAIDYERYKGPVRNAEEFLATKKEKLTYQISLLKIPVGTAVMEATNNNGELRITIRITSNAVFSAIYPVNDFIETRMIKGNYLLTRVRQREGNYQGDFGFTLMLREHKAFWVDRIRNRYEYQSIPRDDVTDAVSGLYLLRNRDLELGKEEQLHLFDSNEYSPTTVEVLRRERIGLPGGREVDTLVVHPQFKTEGFFRRSGEIMLWLTDDEFRVPVRLETIISLGKVTAELLSAESEQEENVREKDLPGRNGTDTP